MNDSDDQNSAGQGDAAAQDQAAGQDELAEAKQKIAELTEAAKHALADLQNYRRRVEEERAQFAQFATVSLLLELLPLLDNFNRAFFHVPEEISKTEWFKGALQIEQQLVGLVRKHGVIEMPSQVGQPLDPNKAEAVAAGPGEQDMVLEEYEKGYLLGEKIIRPAKVKVGRGKS